MTKEQKIEALSNEIRKALPYLMEFSEGCIFFNKRQGYFKAHFISKIADFDLSKTHIIKACVEGNSSANFYYPLSCELVGHEPMLNDILAWHSNKGRNKYSHFEAVKSEGYFFIYDGEENCYVTWNLEKPYLKDQSDELINFLYSLICKES